MVAEAAAGIDTVIGLLGTPSLVSASLEIDTYAEAAE
jgi:hypothetical protein